MADDIGSVRGVTGTSMGLNSQKGAGGQKPMATGNSNPGGCKPERVPEGKVPMPK
jgi:hypothetical protein